jgi:hypothetical protein
LYGPNGGISAHSGKLSALSRRREGGEPQHMAKETKRIGKRGVVFGPPTYLEHSGNEMSSEEEFDEEDMMEMDGQEYDDEEEEEEEADLEPAVAEGESVGGGVRPRAAQAGAPGFDRMEPDDGMDWDAAEAERVQREQEAQNERQEAQQAQHAQQQQLQEQHQHQQQYQRDLQAQQQEQHQRQMQHQQQQRMALAQRQGVAGPSAQQQGGTRAGELNAAGMQDRRPPSERSLSSSSSLAGQPAAPSQVQASRERSGSDLSANSSVQAGRLSPGLSPDAKKEREQRRTSNRKSRGEDDGAEEKSAKKRSGVFSGLFSRKDKKDRKSGTFSDDGVMAGRSSEDSYAGSQGNRRSGAMSPGASTGFGRTVQERDRAQQEAYQRQFLSEPRAQLSPGDSSLGGPGPDYSPGLPNQNFRARPGSLIGTPSTVPMLNVLRVFAGDDIDSDATFKTVLLNEATQAADLVRQSMQRFRLGSGHDPSEYFLSVKLLEGDERALAGHEQPLRVFDQLTDATPERGTPTIPSVKRSSVGSISSISSNLSLNPAIARLGDDFSDDHAVKFYLNRRMRASTRHSSANASPHLSSVAMSNDGSYLGRGALGDGSLTSSLMLPDSSEASQSSAPSRFALRLIIFPSDLPEGTVFDPQTNALIPASVLQERGASGNVASEGVQQQYREKILALPRNTTVAEVIEQGLERFGIMEGLVEGGDDVEERSSRRRSKGRVRYGLSVDLRNKERPLAPASKVLEAYPVQPIFREAPGKSRSEKRRSFDPATLLSMVSDIRSDDPVFILRQVLQTGRSRSARALSPTEGVLIDKVNERRQAELETVAPAPSPRAAAEGAVEAPGSGSAAGMSRQEIIAAQRAAAHERRAAVLGAQRNEAHGVDVVLSDQARIRSSRSAESGRMRYSYVPETGAEQDISAIIEDVLRDQNNALAPGDALRPPISRDVSRGTFVSDAGYESASSELNPSSPLSLREVNLTLDAFGSEGDLQTAPLALNKKSARAPAASAGNADLLETFVRNPAASEANIDERIDQVLSRVAGASSSSMRGGDSYDSRNGRSGSVTPPADARHRVNGSGLSQSQTSPRGADNMSAPMAAVAAVGAGVAAGAAALTAGAVNALSTAVGGGQERADGSSRATPTEASSRAAPTGGARIRTPAPFVGGDFGLEHLYAVVDAAARRDPRRASPSAKASMPVSPRSRAAALSPQVAGLFAPQVPPFEGPAKTRESYSRLDNQLNALEDVSTRRARRSELLLILPCQTLDKLLLDTMRAW